VLHLIRKITKYLFENVMLNDDYASEMLLFLFTKSLFFNFGILS
jgi:hypothetical protein